MVKSSAWVASLLFLLAFALGAASGGAVTYGFAKQEQLELLDEDDGRRLVEHRRVRALTRKLDLDDEQKRKVGDIFREARESRRVVDREIMMQCGDRIREHRAKIDDEIRKVLRPEQLALYDEMVEKRHKRRMRKSRED